MTPEQRERAIRLLTVIDLAAGKGSDSQLAAYRELEWRRCLASCEYWVDNYAYIIDGGRVTKWNLWPIQRQLIRDLQEMSEIARKKFISGGICGVKSRQLGVTTTTAHFSLWDTEFHDATSWDVFSSSEEKGKDIIKRVQATLLKQPQWMLDRARGRVRPDTDKVDRKHKSDAMKKVSFGLSEMKVMSSTPRNIQGATSNIQLDEATLHDDLQDKLDQMHATTDGAHGIGTVIANGKGQDAFYKFYQASKEGKTGYKTYFFWWGTAPHRLHGATVTLHDGRKVPAEQYMKDSDPTYEFLRKCMEAGRLESPWYERMKDKYLLDNPDQNIYRFKAIYPTNEEEAFFISGNSRFDLAQLNEIANQIREEEKANKDADKGKCYKKGFIEAMPEGYVFHPQTTGHLRLWKKPEPMAKYVIGADPSGGGRAGDYGVQQVFKFTDDGIEQVAVYQAKVEPALFAYELDKLGRYYNDALVVIEANNHGGTVIDNIKDGYYNLYMRKRFQNRYITSDASDIGFWTDSSSKPKIIDQLAKWMAEGKIRIRDIETVREMARYQQDPEDSKKTSAPKGANDDLVMGLALAVEGAVDLDSFFVSAEVRTIMPWE